MLEERSILLQSLFGIVFSVCMKIRVEKDQKTKITLSKEFFFDLLKAKFEKVYKIKNLDNFNIDERSFIYINPCL